MQGGNLKGVLGSLVRVASSFFHYVKQKTQTCVENTHVIVLGFLFVCFSNNFCILHLIHLYALYVGFFVSVIDEKKRKKTDILY